jgi:hypothetical protein
MSSDQTRFGVPKAFINRRRKGAESPIAEVEGDDWLKAALCGPCAAASRRIAAAARERQESTKWKGPGHSNCLAGRIARRDAAMKDLTAKPSLR